MSNKLPVIALALGLVAVACAQPQQATVQLGSGTGFVPEVADSLDDAGLFPSVAVTGDGQPYVAYFAFPEDLPEGQIANPRPIGLPSVPGVLLATVHDGIWTRGAIAMAEPISNVNVAFDPATDKAVGDLTPENVTGLDLAIDGQGGLHAAWGAASGLWYASGSGDPASTTPWTLEKVASSPPFGLSLAVDDAGTPSIAYFTSQGPHADVVLVTMSGNTWESQSLPTAGSCSTCSTAVVETSDGPAVAFASGDRVTFASNDQKEGWVSQDVDAGGQGLSGAVGPNETIVLSYYSATSVRVGTGSGRTFQTRAVATAAAESATSEGARTSIAVDQDGTVTVGWYDAATGTLGFGTGKPGEQLSPIPVSDATTGGAFPSVGVAPDGSASYLAWYDASAGRAASGVVPGHDLLLGTYGDIGGVGLAIQSPTPTAVTSVGPTGPSAQCTKVAGGSIDLVAQGLAFDLSCLQPDAGKPFMISFDNKDTGVQHNVAIYPSSTQLTDPLFRGDPTTGPKTTDYKVPALDAGTYYFQCDFHPPTMNGQVIVK